MSKKKEKQTKPKKTRIPCPECGNLLVQMENDELYCRECRKERIIPVGLRERMGRDHLSKPGRWFLVLLTLLLIGGTVWLVVASGPPPALSDKLLDEALDARSAKTGELTVSLVWDTVDDLDLHIITPDGEEISFLTPSAGGGTLDVDSNRSIDGLAAVPVENIYFDSPAEGKYQLKLCEYLDRTPERGANYYIRVRMGGQERAYRGTIDKDGSIEVLTPFRYVNE